MSEPSTAMTVELECNNNAFVFADGEPISQGLLHGAPKPPQATVPTSSSTEDPGDLTQRPCLGDITSTYMAYYAEVIKEDAKLKEEARSPQQLPPAMRPRPGSAVKRLWDDSSADATSPSKSRQVLSPPHNAPPSRLGYTSLFNTNVTGVDAEMLSAVARALHL